MQAQLSIIGDDPLEPVEPLQTESVGYTHRQVVDIAARWLNGKCGVVLPEFACMNAEICDVVGFDGASSHMIEVKVSRSDFHRDKKKYFRRDEDQGIGNYRYYCVPKGLLTPADLPEGWGLINVNEFGKARMAVKPTTKTTNMRAERRVLYSYARRAVVKGLHPEVMKTMAQDAADRNAAA
jgi:hypothetical protein